MASLAWRVVHQGVPVVLVLYSVAVLVVAALATLFRAGSLDHRLGLAGLGIGAWILGVGWGVVVNR